MSIPIETVETGSFRMDYFRFGRGDDVLVVLPGLSVQSVMGLAEAVALSYAPLADDFTIYLFERPRELPEHCEIRDLARDTAEAIRALGLGRVCVFGASMGGMIAQQLAVDQPDLVKKLVLGSTTPRVDDAQYRAIERWAALAERGDARALYLAFGEAIYPPAMFEKLRRLLEETSSTVTAEELARFTVLARSVKGFDVTAELGSIRCPVLALGAADDKVLGAGATRQIAGILSGRPDFELHIYEPGFGHAAYDTAPDYKDRMLRFLTA